MLNIHGLRRSALAVAGLFTVAAAAPPARHNAARFHVHLERSEPAANDTLANAPSALRFWFSEKVELPVTTVKLMRDAGAAVPLSRLTRPDTGKSAPVVASPAKRLSPGTYTVTWSTTSNDGHASKGSFNFLVKPAQTRRSQ